MNERESALRLVYGALPVLKEIDELYNAGINIQQQYRALQNKKQSGQQKNSKILGCIGKTVWVYFVLILASVLLKLASDLGMIPLVSIACTVFCIFVYARNIKKIRNHKSGDPSAEQLPSESDDRVNEALAEITKEIDCLVAENADAINALPRDYRYYHAVQYFEQVLANQRAENMKEAINLYENHLHQLRLEEYQQRIMIQNQRQCEMLVAIERNSYQSARASEATAAAVILSYLS